MEYIDLNTRINIGASSYGRAKAQADVIKRYSPPICKLCGSLKRGEGCTQCVPPEVLNPPLFRNRRLDWLK